MNGIKNIEAIISKLENAKEFSMNKMKEVKDLEEFKYYQGEITALGQCIIECYQEIVNINRKTLN